VSIPYPNRADYATSKAGQRALAENLARFLGPEIQINAISPGPVEGERLRGAGGRAGLYQRRGRLILQSRRLNTLYAAVLRAIRGGAPVATLLDRIAVNRIDAIVADATLPQPLRDAAAGLARDRKEGAFCGHFLMTNDIADKLIARLRRAGAFLHEADRGARFAAEWSRTLEAPPEPFLPPAEVDREADRIRSGVVSQLHLQRMPTEFEVALATVFYLADRAVSGESFQPSGGLNVERSSTERRQRPCSSRRARSRA
jgi:malonyl-CoA reductase/3-hydroxypropionate dehydrogenase (NADP+)